LHEYHGIDLSVLPKYVSYKAALMREKATQKRIIWVLVSFIAVYFAISRWEVSSLSAKLRTKEYIAVPGVENFVTVHPQSVPDDYVTSAVDDFLLKLGNTNPRNIATQYASLSGAMAPDMAVRFQMEAQDWIEKVRQEGITETLAVEDKEIRTNGSGSYQVVALTRRTLYGAGSQLSSFDEVVHLDLVLKPPQEGKRWFLQIAKLTREKRESFKLRKDLSSRGEGS
jgi:hypothetical protein